LRFLIHIDDIPSSSVGLSTRLKDGNQAILFSGEPYQLVAIANAFTFVVAHASLFCVPREDFSKHSSSSFPSLPPPPPQ